MTALSNGNSYAYDANGNMTARPVGGQAFNLSYDGDNRLVGVSGAVTDTATSKANRRQRDRLIYPTIIPVFVCRELNLTKSDKSLTSFSP